MNTSIDFIIIYTRTMNAVHCSGNRYQNDNTLMKSCILDF